MENIEPQLSQFHEALRHTIKKTWESGGNHPFMEALVVNVRVLFDEIVRLEDHCTKQLQTANTKSKHLLLPYYIINYSWSGLAKSFLILWRDILFQYQKGIILHLNGECQEDDLDDLKQASYQTIQAAAEELAGFLPTATKRIRQKKNGLDRQIAEWSLQKNPWPTYKEQLNRIPLQCQQILQQFGEMKAIASNFQSIKQHIDQTLVSANQEIAEARTLAQNTIGFIESNFENSLRKIPPKLKEQEDEITPQNYVADFGLTLEDDLVALKDKKQVPFQTIGGLIQYKEINFQRSTRLWLESEILPLLYEVWELSATVSHSLKMSFVNIRNRSLLLTNEKHEGINRVADRESICQPLNAFLQKVASWEKSFSALDALVRDRLQRDFQISAIYHTTEAFLPIPLQSTLNQFKLNQNQVLLRIKNWFHKQLSVIQRVKVALEREEALSTSEKIVRFIEDRKGDQSNHQYTSIFLTKGYIGESFWVGREKELQHMETLIAQWKTGFRGSVMLSGRRFSGKSLFGELIANRYFAQNTIRLAPNTTIHLQGRRYTTNYDLEEALEFVQKYTINSPMLVWIDDLELWGDANFSLNRNLRVLYEYIDSYARRLFFLVATSHWKKAQLNLLHDVNRIFQATINLDRMSVEEIKAAILIRHGATHKVLVNTEAEELNPQQYKKIANKIIKVSRNNVGESLNLWALSTKKLDEEKVCQPFQATYMLPDFITPENALLLRALTIEKRINEYMLRRQFGPAFKGKYSGILQRLISIGLLTRNLDGWLEVNEVVANEIGLLLEQKQYLL
ncbi:MAG: hypothetical protein R2828_21345 [Saprospiraceae bacterium]